MLAKNCGLDPHTLLTCLENLPLIAAPMFLVSNPDMAIACCNNGIVGSFPALNERTTSGYEKWLQRVAGEVGHPDGACPYYAVNLVVHRSNQRLGADLELTCQYRVPIVITSLGTARRVIDRVHAYGGLVLHDVTTLKHAKKALAAGVDGVIAVSAGAGGHGGTLNPFAFVAELRNLTDKLVVLAGAISNGNQIVAAQAAGADLAYMGTRFIGTQESTASESYKRMLLETDAAGIVYTPKISGIPANFITESIRENGIDLDTIHVHDDINMCEELNHKGLAWKYVWSAGQGCGSVNDIPPVAHLCERLRGEYLAALQRLGQYAANGHIDKSRLTR